MSLILQILINAGLLVLLAAVLPSVKVKSYGTAIAVAIVIGLLNSTLGFIIRLPLNIVTLGLLTFLVRLFVSAIIIYLTDKLFSGFELKSFGTAFIVALVLAIAASLLSYS